MKQFPHSHVEMIAGVIVRIEDLKTIIYQTNEHRRLILIAAAKNLQSWFVKGKWTFKRDSYNHHSNFLFYLL